MKHLKSFERTETYKDINHGEYVILNIKHHYLFRSFRNSNSQKFLKYINCTIGKVLTVLNTNEIILTYDNIPNNVTQFFNYNNHQKYHMTFNIDDVEFHSRNKDDVEEYLQAKKYNL